MVYTGSIVIIYILAILIESTIYCAKHFDRHSDALITINIILCAIVLIINPIIVGTVLNSFKSRIGASGTIRTIFIKIVLLGCLFEVAFALRIILIYYQYEWKENSPWLWNIVFTLYIILGEVACQIVLISGVIIYSHKLRVKYLRSSPTNSSG